MTRPQDQKYRKIFHTVRIQLSQLGLNREKGRLQRQTGSTYSSAVRARAALTMPTRHSFGHFRGAVAHAAYTHPKFH